ncbi:MAG: protein phosphatase 2C domain-containing protein [Kofleriaceae bacterium]
MLLSSVARTDVGRRRQINEDAFFRDDEMGFYVVADGVGGHNRGEIASREAVEQLRSWVFGASRDLDKLITDIGDGELEKVWQVRRLLENGVQSACYMVFGMAQLDPEKRGMSTTLSALLIRGGLAFAAHVGDSRVYRLRGDGVLQLTEDHTLINYKIKQGLMTRGEAERAVGKNVITRAVGHKDYVQVDTVDIDVQRLDRFVLCSDGLHTYLQSDAEVAQLIADGPIEEGAEASISLANQRGGKDNITTLVVEVLE